MIRSLPLLLVLSACAAPDASALFQRLQVQAPQSAKEANALFTDAIDTAEVSVHAAIPRGSDPEVAQALIKAWDLGLEVEVVTDIDVASDEGIEALVAAGVPVTLADAGIEYFDFNILGDVSWTSEETIMSHAFAVIDEHRVVNASSIGTEGDGVRIVFEAAGEDIAEDHWIEHNQVFGGADAVATTAYDAQAKSVADFRWRYDVDDDVELQVWFGPQERVTKRVIDAVYGAKSSVWVLTDDFANDGLAKALQDKAAFGFDVRVIVGPSFGTTTPALSTMLEQQTPDVPKYRITLPVEVPTLVLIDYDEARNDRQYASSAMVISHDLYASARLHEESEVVNDQLIDGNLWVLTDWDGPGEKLELLRTVWTDALDQAEEL